MRAWIASEVVAPLAAVGVVLRFTLLRYDNVLHKVSATWQCHVAVPRDSNFISCSIPLLCSYTCSLHLADGRTVAAFHPPTRFPQPGPAFNFMMAAAAEDGADYLYRVNDDTEVRTGSLEPVHMP